MKWYILFSHPPDFTPVCTTEFVVFQKRCEKFKKLHTGKVVDTLDLVHPGKGTNTVRAIFFVDPGGVVR